MRSRLTVRESGFATGAYDVTRSSSRTGTGPQGSISAHPLFPAIVALWFAALLGIGSLILPAALFDRLAALGGDVSLGMTMRTVIAVIAALGGAGLGVFLARQVAATGRAAATPRTREAAAKRPISALDELGPEGLDEPLAAPAPHLPAPEPIPGRRRPLSVTDETGPSEFLDHAPLPGDGDALDIMDHDQPSEETALELGEFAQEAHDATEPFGATDDGLFGSGALSDSPTADPLAPPAPRHAILRPAAPVEDDVQRFAAPAEPATGRPAFGAAFGMPQPIADERAPAPVAIAPLAPPPAPTTERPLHDLGMVELVERFALSLQNAASRAAPATTVLTETVAAITPPAPAASTAPFASPASQIPAALRPIGFGDDLDHDDEAELAFRIAPQPAPFAAPVAPLPAEAEDEADDNFASLLAMRSTLGDSRETVRFDDEPAHAGFEPVVIFPGQETRRAAPAADGPARDAGAPFALDFSRPGPFAAPAARASDPAATEAALRDALAKLQRISGVA